MVGYPEQNIYVWWDWDRAEWMDTSGAAFPGVDDDGVDWAGISMIFLIQYIMEVSDWLVGLLI